MLRYWICRLTLNFACWIIHIRIAHHPKQSDGSGWRSGDPNNSHQSMTQKWQWRWRCPPNECKRTRTPKPRGQNRKCKSVERENTQQKNLFLSLPPTHPIISQSAVILSSISILYLCFVSVCCYYAWLFPNISYLPKHTTHRVDWTCDVLLSMLLHSTVSRCVATRAWQNTIETNKQTKRERNNEKKREQKKTKMKNSQRSSNSTSSRISDRPCNYPTSNSATTMTAVTQHS